MCITAAKAVRRRNRVLLQHLHPEAALGTRLSRSYETANKRRMGGRMERPRMQLTAVVVVQPRRRQPVSRE